MRSNPLLTDLYQLTMLQSYYEQGMQDTAVFEFFVRRLPPGRNFMLLAGIEQVLDYLENLRFSAEDLDYLRDSGKLNPTFVDNHLANFRFTGNVHAMAEGTVFFAEEPVVRVTAPLPEAQLVESRLINILHYQSLIATKAARCRIAGRDKALIDFGMRRSHGAEAAIMAARASYIAGFAGTATVEAGSQFGIPVFGTMAHSYIQTHESELSAFENFARSHPDNVVLLIDTYDLQAGARKVVELSKSLREEGIEVSAVRIDSGDLATGALAVRKILNDGGEKNISIFASGDLDEYKIGKLVSAACPIDAFGVGTRLNTSGDAPSLDCVYKLQEYAGRATRKRSEGKSTWPGAKQVFRQFSDDGKPERDIVTLESDTQFGGEALLAPVMRNGQRISPPESLAQIRGRATEQLDGLPPHLKRLQVSDDAYPVEISRAIRRLADEIDQKLS